MAELILQNAPRLHVRFEGRSWDVLLADLELGGLSSDSDIRQATARHFDVPAGKFNAYLIERHGNGNLTVRPEAVFG